ncbi:hypothetical protein D3C87_1735970 [compost metagenome]
MTISTKSAPPTASPTTRIGMVAGETSTATAWLIALSQSRLRRSMERETSGGGIESRLSSRRAPPTRAAMARAPTPISSRFSLPSGRPSSGAPSSTSAATCAAAIRSCSQLRRKFAMDGK